MVYFNSSVNEFEIVRKKYLQWIIEFSKSHRMKSTKIQEKMMKQLPVPIVNIQIPTDEMEDRNRDNESDNEYW